jgi:hypothetical protein
MSNTDYEKIEIYRQTRSHRGPDCIVVVNPTTYAISAYYHQSCEVESCSWNQTESCINL